jgi:hypothetical protein
MSRCSTNNKQKLYFERKQANQACYGNSVKKKNRNPVIRNRYLLIKRCGKNGMAMAVAFE